MATLRARVTAAIAFASLLLTAPGCGAERATAFDRSETMASGAAVPSISSPAFADGQPIPERFSDYGAGVSPPLSWEPVAGAVSYALLMEDPDADRPEPYVHWVAWNIPAATRALAAQLPPEAGPAVPDGMRQGVNDRGSVGYFGPRPPAGSGLHHYQIQVFALDTTLDLPVDADRAGLVRAMRGHVLGKARLVGTYAAPQD